jgi:hypothetical protein
VACAVAGQHRDWSGSGSADHSSGNVYVAITGKVSGQNKQWWGRDGIPRLGLEGAITVSQEHANG